MNVIQAGVPWRERRERMGMPDGDSPQPMRVILVEDNAYFRRAMVALLDRQPDLKVVAQAGSVKEARACAASVGFDVAVLDLGLPDGDGTDVLADLRGARPGAAVLILSASLDPTSLLRAREGGVNGVLDKFATPAEIVGAIRGLRDQIGLG